jgi:hypothetical protein
MASGSGGDRIVLQELRIATRFESCGTIRDTLPTDHGDANATNVTVGEHRTVTSMSAGMNARASVSTINGPVGGKYAFMI